jgi:hypothetical protein
MERKWTPISRVSVTDAGMIIELELGAVPISTVVIRADGGELCVNGEHDDWGKFECRFAVAPGHNMADARSSFTNGVLRIELPWISATNPQSGTAIGTDSLMSFPRPMLIYCNDCGKHFDIVLTSGEPAEYQCPTCGAVQKFAFGAFVNKAIEQSRKMAGKTRGRR